MSEKLEILVSKANKGDRKALTSVILGIKDMVYNLSLKMLLFPDDAKDATQEILIKVITHLSTFKGESRFSTWVYRVAVNYLLTAKSSKSRTPSMSFAEYAQLIDTGQSERVTYAENDGELLLLEEEVKISCTHGLLLCLDKMNRMVYILAEILDFNGVEGAEILGISAESFRQKLSRSRAKIRAFLQSKCGLVNKENSCRCKKKIDFLVGENMINPKRLQYAKHTNRSIDLMEKISVLEKTVLIYRSVPGMKAPPSVMRKIRNTINTINI